MDSPKKKSLTSSQSVIKKLAAPKKESKVKNSKLPKEPINKGSHSFTNGNIGIAFDSFLLAYHIPASVVINHDLEILQFRGSTETFLKYNSGKASFNILRMARPEITFELRNSIHHAIKSKHTVIKTGIEINSEKEDSYMRTVTIEVSSLKVEGEEPLLAITFTVQEMEITSQAAHVGKNKELQSANEEVISSNVELQNLNEELETSKEEIESTNEELTTSNQELAARILEVEEQYAYYEDILSTLQEPMLVLDKDMRIILANNAFYKVFLSTAEESIGISFYKLGNNQWNIPRLREMLDNIVPKNNRVHNFEIEHTFPVVGFKTMLLNVQPIQKKSNNEEMIVLTIIDITEVRNLRNELHLKEKNAIERELRIKNKAFKLVEESNNRYDRIFMESAFSFAVLKGKDMIISLANESIKKTWGKGKYIEGKSLLQVLPEIKDEPFPELLNQVFATGIPYQGYEIPAPIFRKGKLEQVYFNFVYQPLKEADETISGVTIIAYEVTSNVMLKKELEEAKRVAELKTEIAETAVRTKQQFLSNMSHEIRTPMNSIIGFTNLILRTKLGDKQMEYINAIKVSGDALITLINDILDLAKVDAGKMIFKQNDFNLKDLIATALQLFELKIKEKNLALIVKLDTAVPDFLIGDDVRLRQIFINLIGNAVKFTEQGSIAIAISKLKEEEEKTTLEFTISDTGIGIHENELELVFRNFEQSSTSQGGTGLGLPITKQLVEHQGGVISLKSQLGKGTIIAVTLNFGKSKSISEVKPHVELNANTRNNLIDETAAKIRVLVAEDLLLNQLLIKIILQEFNFEVDIAENGKIAIEKLENENFDIILMDLQMPEMNGFEATSYIRKKLNSKIPIIALTADATVADENKTLANGMNDYLSKPIDEKLLYSKILKHLNKARE